MTQLEAVITKILNCGTCDLSLLEDIEYDLDDIVQECMDDGCLSLKEIIRRVFYKAADDLQCAFDEREDSIRESILEAIASDKEEWVTSGEMTMEELEECDEYQELISDLRLIDSGELHPSEDIDFYSNCLDTHVYMKHIDFYRRWMEKEVDEIESNMGWMFGDRYW